MSECPDKILYIDDDSTMRKMVRSALSGIDDLELEIFDNGEDGVQRALSFKPDIILLDLKMPDCDGPETLRMLRQSPETLNIPVVFLTGVTKITMEDDYAHLGVVGVVHKPFDIEKLADMVNDFWQTYERQKEKELA